MEDELGKAVAIIDTFIKEVERCFNDIPIKLSHQVVYKHGNSSSSLQYCYCPKSKQWLIFHYCCDDALGVAIENARCISECNLHCKLILVEDLALFLESYIKLQKSTFAKVKNAVVGFLPEKYVNEIR
jgi:hypothetical protein